MKLKSFKGGTLEEQNLPHQNAFDRWIVLCLKKKKNQTTKDGGRKFDFPLTTWASQVLSGKASACQCRRYRFSPWVMKLPWRRKWQPTPVCLPEQRSLVGYSPWGRKTIGHILATKQQIPAREPPSPDTCNEDGLGMGGKLSDEGPLCPTVSVRPSKCLPNTCCSTSRWIAFLGFEVPNPYPEHPLLSLAEDIT